MALVARPLDLRPRRQKYNARRTLYNDQWYDSKREAAYAEQLDLMVRAREIAEWSRPVSIPLVVQGVEVCKYRPDFLVVCTDGRAEYHEVKGRIAAHSRIKMALFRALFPHVVLKIIR